MMRRRKRTIYDKMKPSNLPLFLKGVLLVEGFIFVGFLLLAFAVIFLIIKLFFITL